jgi:hypothetical protein
MPDERFFHKRLGHSEKVCSLTDLEFRVWAQYELSADDYGLMLFTAAKIQADNIALARRPAKQVMRGLEAVAAVGLIHTFEHQGLPYALQFDWQDFQRIRHPRAALHPCPPVDVLAMCTPDTIDLFRSHPGCPPDVLSEDFRSLSGKIPTPARAGGRETANGKRLPANGSGVDQARARFERFWQSYPRRVGKEAAWQEWRRLRPSADDAFVDRAIAAVERQRQSLQWQRDDGQYIPHPRTWLHQGRWQDDADAPAPIQLAPEVDWFEECKQLHSGSCGSSGRHRTQKLIDAEKTRQAS